TRTWWVGEFAACRSRDTRSWGGFRDTCGVRRSGNWFRFPVPPLRGAELRNHLAGRGSLAGVPRACLQAFPKWFRNQGTGRKHAVSLVLALHHAEPPRGVRNPPTLD